MTKSVPIRILASHPASWQPWSVPTLNNLLLRQSVKILGLQVSQIGDATGAQSAGTVTATFTGISKASTRVTVTASIAISTATSSAEATLAGSPNMFPDSIPSTNLSAGAIAGISIGAVIAVLLIILVALLCYQYGQQQALRLKIPPVEKPPTENANTVSSPIIQEPKGSAVPVAVAKQLEHSNQCALEIDSQTVTGGRAELEQ